ncbi:ribulose-1,5 bisphosphate carboxylase/oxygenase large subunit N-methyltransferase, chloroplastic isoform X2 [Nicotiana sylvestris]
MGSHAKFVYIQSSASTVELKSSLNLMLQRARIINLDELELYFSGEDVTDLVEFNSPRNEMEALNSILTAIAKLGGEHSAATALQELRVATVNLISEVAKNFKEERKVVTVSSCEQEKCLQQWGEDEGVKSQLEISYFEGAGRGAVARQDMRIGDIAMEIPLSIVISENLVHASQMHSILGEVEGMSAETMLLLWSMKERHNPDSKFKLYFDTLPEKFKTGLSFGIEAIMSLDGTLLLEEIVQAKEHLRTQYDELFPALCNDHLDVFPPELYTWEQFLWACELWYSNSMKIMFNDGKLRTCLVPIAGFLNHSSCPHIVHYGKVDFTTNSIKFPLSRPCNAGEQCFLGYGNFSSSHLLTFYGFLPQLDNYYDVIPLDIDVESNEGFADTGPTSDWTSHMIRGTWFSKNRGFFRYGLPPSLLDHMRRSRNPFLQTFNLTPEKLEIELEILRDLCSMFQDMTDALGDAQLDDRETTSWDTKLALDFKYLQRRIFYSVVASCQAGCELVESELQRYRL